MPGDPNENNDIPDPMDSPPIEDDEQEEEDDDNSDDEDPSEYLLWIQEMTNDPSFEDPPPEDDDEDKPDDYKWWWPFSIKIFANVTIISEDQPSHDEVITEFYSHKVAYLIDNNPYIASKTKRIALRIAPKPWDVPDPYPFPTPTPHDPNDPLDTPWTIGWNWDGWGTRDSSDTDTSPSPGTSNDWTGMETTTTQASWSSITTTDVPWSSWTSPYDWGSWESWVTVVTTDNPWVSMDALLIQLDFVLTEAHWSNAYQHHDSEAYQNLSKVLSEMIDKVFSLWMDLAKNVIHVSVYIEEKQVCSDSTRRKRSAADDDWYDPEDPYGTNDPYDCPHDFILPDVNYTDTLTPFMSKTVRKKRVVMPEHDDSDIPSPFDSPPIEDSNPSPEDDEEWDGDPNWDPNNQSPSWPTDPDDIDNMIDDTSPPSEDDDEDKPDDYRWWWPFSLRIFANVTIISEDQPAQDELIAEFYPKKVTYLVDNNPYVAARTLNLPVLRIAPKPWDVPDPYPFPKPTIPIPEDEGIGEAPWTIGWAWDGWGTRETSLTDTEWTSNLWTTDWTTTETDWTGYNWEDWWTNYTPGWMDFWSPWQYPSDWTWWSSWSPSWTSDWVYYDDEWFRGDKFNEKIFSNFENFVCRP